MVKTKQLYDSSKKSMLIVPRAWLRALNIGYAERVRMELEDNKITITKETENNGI